MPASRSLIALLIGTVAFFALWLVALKPGGSGKSGSSSQGLGQYQSAINKAHQAVATSNASNAASGNDGTASSTSTTAASGGASSTTSSNPTQPATQGSTATQPGHPARAAKRVHTHAAMVRLSTVKGAMAKHKVVAMLFYNPLAADDAAVKNELASVPTHHGRVVKLTIPLSEASNFTAVTQQVPVNFSPTLVLIAPNGQAGEIVGFSDQLEIAQRVDDALTTR
jgi:hypothetical protein